MLRRGNRRSDPSRSEADPDPTKRPGEPQGQVVQETVVSLVEFWPGTAAPWHMHPGAQELLHVFDGSGSDRKFVDQFNGAN
jgi:quercetin dioxygenase-like cupin family protein